MVGFVDKNLIKRMCDVIEGRWPDDSGIFILYLYEKEGKKVL